MPVWRGSIQQAVKDIRKTLELTQEELASRLKVSLPSVRRWEAGRTHPDALALQAIHRLLARTGPAGRDLLAKHFPGPGALGASPRRRGKERNRDSREEIARNHYNLSPSRYVETAAPAEHRDIQSILDDLAAFDTEARRLDGDLRVIFASLGYRWGGQP